MTYSNTLNYVTVGPEYTNSISAEEQDSTNKYPRHDTKQSDNEAADMLELWGMQSTPALPSLPGPLWTELVSTDRVQYIGQVKLFDLNCEIMLN